MQVELTPLEAIVAAGSTKTYYKKVCAHYAEKGCPGMMKAVTQEHLDATLSSHRALIAALRKEGYVMRGGDIDAQDHDALMARPWIAPPTTPSETA